MKSVYIKTIGGICNRFYAIASAYKLAKDQNKELIIFWDKEWNLNSDLKKFIKFDNLNIKCRDKYNFPKRFIDKFDTSIKKAFDNSDFRILDSEMSGMLVNKSLDEIKEYFFLTSTLKSIFIETCWQFYPLNNDVLKELFQPTLYLQSKLNEINKNIGNDYIGFHIRRTDHDRSIKYSPDYLFLDIANKYPDKKVFLSTDCIETEVRFRHILGERLFTFTKNKNRDSEKGIEDALIDLFTLSKSNIIYGSFASTFSSFASNYGNIPLVVLKIDES
jgi:hypothetical protein